MNKSKRTPFTIEPCVAGRDKSVVIYGPGADDWDSLTITVDFDEVDHESIAEQVKKMVSILNAHWNDKAKR